LFTNIVTVESAHGYPFLEKVKYDSMNLYLFVHTKYTSHLLLGWV
jgi:hypothetical protein